MVNSQPTDVLFRTLKGTYTNCIHRFQTKTHVLLHEWSMFQIPYSGEHDSLEWSSRTLQIAQTDSRNARTHNLWSCAKRMQLLIVV